MSSTRNAPAPDQPTLADRYREVRSTSRRLAAPLTPEDCVVQSMPDVSPTKWHLAHVTWFFETFVVAPRVPDYRSPAPQYAYLFNSYYNSIGSQYSRPHRGLLTRPTLDEVMAYRDHVDRAMEALLDASPGPDPETAELVVLGLNHEQQHQELLLMDIKHVFSCNPCLPAYEPRDTWPRLVAAAPLEWIEQPGGLVEIGHDGDGFAYDNELPRHQAFVAPFRIASRLVTNGEYLEFMNDGGYDRPDPWLADGWTSVREEGWNAPLYWRKGEDGWSEFSLFGLRPLDPGAPVCHLSYFEATAYARWAGGRLPTEAEWEATAAAEPTGGNFLESGVLHPRPVADGAGDGKPRQLFGDLWEWTQSAYSAYPGYRAPDGAIGEYNGKFMCNQYVLRGGACVTPSSHIRRTYRNFFYPHCRWQFSGLRLVRD
jgi:ergothioneine biosynthesis protein EgtB